MVIRFLICLEGMESISSAASKKKKKMTNFGVYVVSILD